MQHLHASNYLHSDLKTSNVVVTMNHFILHRIFKLLILYTLTQGDGVGVMED